jgi:hypothetical protein
VENIIFSIITMPGWPASMRHIKKGTSEKSCRQESSGRWMTVRKAQFPSSRAKVGKHMERHHWSGDSEIKQVRKEATNAVSHARERSSILKLVSVAPLPV